MRPRGTGHIVNIASLAGKAGYPNLATYAATKHAVVGLSEAVRFELKGSGVEISVRDARASSTRSSRAACTEARGVKNLTPEQVAAEVVGALEVPRFDVFVPRSTGPLLKVAGILPRRAREALAHVMKADQVAVAVDASKRAAYESRVAASAPTADKVAEVQLDRSHSRLGAGAQPVRDQGADERSLVLLEEVAGALDHPRRRLAERARERLARPHGQHRVRVAPQDQRRPGVLAQRGERAPARLRAGVVGRQRQDRRERAGARLGRLARERRVVGGGDLVARVGRAGAPHEQAHRQLVDALDELAEAVPLVAHRLLAGEHAGVHQHEPVDAVGELDRDAQADRAAPVVADERRAAQVEVLDEPRRGGDVAVVGVPVLVDRLVRAAEARAGRA